MSSKTPHTLRTAAIYAAIALLTVLDEGMSRVSPYIYHVNVNWRPAGEMRLLLVYILPNTNGVTHMVGCSLGAITTAVTSIMMNQLTIIFWLL